MAEATAAVQAPRKFMVVAPVGRTIAVPYAIRRMVDQRTGMEMDYWEEECVLYEGGTVLDESQVSPRLIKLIDAQDPHALSVIRPITEEQAQQAALGNFTITVPNPGENPFLVTTGDDNPITAQHSVATRIRTFGE